VEGGEAVRGGEVKQSRNLVLSEVDAERDAEDPVELGHCEAPGEEPHDGVELDQVPEAEGVNEHESAENR
jgi:hypothetical protein